MRQFVIYKTTNLVNNKFYIGCHVTENINDNYMGSGKLLNAAIKKYGLQNFKKDILYVFSSPEEMFEKEKEIVNEEFIKRKDVYNIKPGGNGGWYNLNYGSQTHLNNRFDNKWQKKISGFNNLTKADRKKAQENRAKTLEERGGQDWTSYGFLGKSHNQKTRNKMSRSHKGKHDGEKNSQFGTCWILKDNESKKIKLEDLEYWLSLGWIKGRKIKK